MQMREALRVDFAPYIQEPLRALSAIQTRFFSPRASTVRAYRTAATNLAADGNDND